MAFLIELFKLAHVLIGFWYVAGLLGRGVTQLMLERAADIGAVKTLVPLLGRFDNLMVIPASMLVLLTGLVTAVLQGQPLLGFLQGASANWLLVSLVLFLSGVPLVPFIFIPKGRRFEAALNEAVSLDRVTERFSSSLRDPAVRAAHVWELVVVFLVICLMIAKPF